MKKQGKTVHLENVTRITKHPLFCLLSSICVNLQITMGFVQSLHTHSYLYGRGT